MQIMVLTQKKCIKLDLIGVADVSACETFSLIYMLGLVLAFLALNRPIQTKADHL